MHAHSQAPPRAVVIAVQLPGVSDGELESSLEELERLAKTLGLVVAGRITQKRAGLARAAVLGEGKLAELASRTGGTGVVPTGPTRKRRRNDPEPEEPETPLPPPDVDDDDESSGTSSWDGGDDAEVVLVDHELSPRQARNLERATGAQVLDRTSVILSIFQRHARTREARLQVEIARLAYEAPRMRETGAGGDRQRGGIGGKGAGESALELDRRRNRDRIAELRAELAAIVRDSGTRRARRSELPTVALVGYTNAGKSSWMRALTGGEPYVANKLFATLDTTVRALVPETRPRTLVSDTVGFIKKLPHDLVASFRSTLEEARDASLLLHVVDAADAAFRDQLALTREVLAELEADEAPSLLVLNKADLIDEAGRAALREEFPDALLVSAKEPADLARLHGRIVEFLEREMEDTELRVPWKKHAVVAAIHESARVLEEDHDEDGTRLVLRAAPLVIERLRAML